MLEWEIHRDAELAVAALCRHRTDHPQEEPVPPINVTLTAEDVGLFVRTLVDGNGPLYVAALLRVVIADIPRELTILLPKWTEGTCFNEKADEEVQTVAPDEDPRVLDLRV